MRSGKGAPLLPYPPTHARSVVARIILVWTGNTASRNRPCCCSPSSAGRGAYAGRSLFRHKTRKQPFNSNLFQIAAGQMLALGGLIGWWVNS